MTAARRVLRRAALIVLVVIAVVAIVVVVVPRFSRAVRTPRTSQASAARIGVARFDRGAAHCRERRISARTTAEDPGLILGINASLRFFTGLGRCEELVLAQATGVQEVREDLDWYRIEPHPGEYRWGLTDSLVGFAARSGMTLLPILDGAPKWAAASQTTLPIDTATYGSFVAAVVKRYGPGGVYWREHPGLSAEPIHWFELWNEPYVAQGNRSPALYAEMVKDAVTAARRVSPAAQFLIEGITFFTPVGGGVMQDWINGMYAAVPNLGEYFDAMAIHPYGGDPGLADSSDPDTDPRDEVEQAHADLVARGDGDKPLWVTEIGWSTCSDPSICVTQTQQAQYLERFLGLTRTVWRSYVKAVFVYDLRDIAPAASDNAQADFGVLSADLSHKPAWSVLHAFATGSR
jgi:hypothetical protein